MVYLYSMKNVTTFGKLLLLFCLLLFLSINMYKNNNKE